MYYNNYNNYIKYKKKYMHLKYGGSSKYNYIYLLSDDDDDVDTKNPELQTFIKLKKDLKLYISTPWDGKNYYTDTEYKRLLAEKILSQNIESSTICKKEPNNTLCQNHGGNLFEHSQWSALIIYIWFRDKHELVRYINDYKYKKLAIIAGFFHDIGKGGDCFYNVYDENKYDRQKESIHPEYCADMIIGKKEYILYCLTNNNINIKDLLQNLFKFDDIEIQIIALLSYMHWEFGNFNIPDSEYTYIDYSNKFIFGFNKYFNQEFKNLDDIYKYLNNIHINLLELLRLCILISCADITAGTNKHVIHDLNLKYFNISKLKYLSKDGWVFYNMYQKYNEYRLKLILYFYDNINHCENIQLI
jgi:hypothetical protein